MSVSATEVLVGVVAAVVMVKVTVGVVAVVAVVVAVLDVMRTSQNRFSPPVSIPSNLFFCFWWREYDRVRGGGIAQNLKRTTRVACNSR